MRKTYRILADIVAVAVVIQAMAMVWAIAGLFHWLDSDGGSIDAAVLDSWEDDPPDFDGSIGFAIHGILGGMGLPLLALILLIIAFFAKVPGGVKWAAIVLGLVVLQVFLGYTGFDVPAVGLIHGLNAFALFSCAILAARRAHPTDQTAMAATP